MSLRTLAPIVLLTGFVGAMVGSERSALPLLATRDFGRVSATAALSFLVAFGFAKAAANLFVGAAANRFGLRALLVAGWLVGAAVPLVILTTHSLTGLVVANVFLGVNQGTCWSATVLLAMRSVPAARRGLAMGVNECGGYVAMALAALAVGAVTGRLGDRVAVSLVGGVACAAGLALSIFVPIDDERADAAAALAVVAAFRRGFADRRVFALNQAGLVNNMKDGAAWGLFPLFYKSINVSPASAASLVALYPAVWGITQLGTGALSDRFGRVRVVAIGLGLQAIAFGGMTVLGTRSVSAEAVTFALAASLAVLLGLGTGMVHPTLMAAVGDVTSTETRAATLGVYRMWRDSGYAFGALLAGGLADAFGPKSALGGVGALVAVAAVVFVGGMRPYDGER